MPRDLTDEQIGARMRASRERARLPQQHVAVAMAAVHGHQWHQTTVAKVEAGQRPMKLTEAAAVAEIIGIPLADLVSQHPSLLETGARLAELHRMQEYIERRAQELGS